MSEIVRKVLDEEPAPAVIDSAKLLRDFTDELRLRAGLFDPDRQDCPHRYGAAAGRVRARGTERWN